MVLHYKEAKKQKEIDKLNCMNCILSFAIISIPQKNFEIYKETRYMNSNASLISADIGLLGTPAFC